MLPVFLPIDAFSRRQNLAIFDLLNYSLLNLRVKGDGAKGGLFANNLNDVVCLAKRDESTHRFYCYKWMFMVAWFIMAQNCNQSKCLSSDEQTHQQQCVYTMDYC